MGWQTLKRSIGSAIALGVATLAILTGGRAHAINIVIDYRYDPAGPGQFFDTQLKKDALQAAANRFSSVITSSLTAETLTDAATDDLRIGFTHPKTGLQNFEVSSANSAATDFLVTNLGVTPANEYRGTWSIGANDWILYPGGRSLTSAAVGGTGTGTNLTTVFDDGNSHINRGIRPSGSVNRLPVWGGSISFDNDGTTVWHFGLNTPVPAGTIDFYSIALHEIGHALGLSAGFSDWTQFTTSGPYNGPKAVNAYNDDNNTAVSSLQVVSAGNQHWKDATYKSFIFHNGNPNYVETVGPGALQDLLMEPTANFTGTVKRFELTNVDVGALDDIGWSVLPEINVLAGDYNNNGVVDAADYVLWRKVGASVGTYATWRAHFGETGSGAGSGSFTAGVPEPSAAAMCCFLLAAGFTRRRRVL